MVSSIDENEVYADFARPGGWNVGNDGMKKNEYIVHFSLWAISKAPLLLRCDVRNMTKEQWRSCQIKRLSLLIKILLASKLKKIRMEGNLEIWAEPLSNYRVVLILLNRNSLRYSITANWDDIGIPKKSVVEARDLLMHTTLANKFVGSLTAIVDSHSCKMYILKPIS
ncbi:hypothetical protein ACFE04_006716 [Oxalis oulophora]